VMVKRATVLFSGGIDSTSCIELLKRDGFEVTGCFVDFGQASAKMERRSVSVLSQTLSITVHTITISAQRKFETGELTGRNAMLVFNALLLGNCPDGLIALGIHAGSGYYDCSPSFIDRIDPLVQECTNGKISVIAPFLYWQKDDIYSFFLNTGIPISETYSCEAGGEMQCGVCASCKDRTRLEC
jgi:7-cyano-7-deazaguanine synthase